MENYLTVEVVTRFGISSIFIFLVLNQLKRHNLVPDGVYLINVLSNYAQHVPFQAQQDFHPPIFFCWKLKIIWDTAHLAKRSATECTYVSHLQHLSSLSYSMLYLRLLMCLYYITYYFLLCSKKPDSKMSIFEPYCVFWLWANVILLL